MPNPGRPLSEERKRQISESMKGKNTGPKSEETKQKIAASLRGGHFTRSEETKQKISEARKRYWAEQPRRPQHPLGDPRGCQRVLFEKLGCETKDCPHACHWCGELRVWGRGLDGITVDHLDWDTSNNAPENLVPSCHTCNTKRKRPGGYPKNRKRPTKRTDLSAGLSL